MPRSYPKFKHLLFVWGVSHRVIILIRRLSEVEGDLQFGGRQESGTDSRTVIG
jgi:hypothetical protein